MIAVALATLASLALAPHALGAVTTATPAAHAVADPVAVMKFEDLNRDDALAWMGVGIAETMVSDLKKSGKVRVVERERIDQAMTEILLQKLDKGGAESTAARVGKLVGAKTIVLGSFQKAGAKLRINARFVNVETGEILSTAKTTGPAKDPFTLQDQIVAKLLGLKPGAPALPKRKPATKKTVEAYHLYAMALTVASDAERAGLLQKSLELDPDFVYSSDELEALRQRLEGLSRKSSGLVADEAAQLFAEATDPKHPDDERARDVAVLFQKLDMARRWNTMLLYCDRVERASIPSIREIDTQETASAARVRALFNLNRWDLALQAGEAHEKRYTGGMRFREIEGLMNVMIQTRQVWERRRPEYEADVAEKRADIEKKPKPWSSDDQMQYDYAPCIASIWDSEQNELMLDGCSTFLATWEDKIPADSQWHMFVTNAQFSVVLALSKLGRFDEAREKAEALMKSGSEETPRLRMLMQSFPADAPPRAAAP